MKAIILCLLLLPGFASAYDCSSVKDKTRETMKLLGRIFK